MHTINLVVGDWSRDGHEKTETIQVKSSLTLAELNAAYALGSRRVEFDLSAEVAKEYEDDFMLKQHIDMLAIHGIVCEDYNESEDDGVGLDPELFATLFMKIAQLGNCNLLFEFVDDSTSTINIGGYGLFY